MSRGGVGSPRDRLLINVGAVVFAAVTFASSQWVPVENAVGIAVVAVVLVGLTIGVWKAFVSEWLKDRALEREVGGYLGPPPILVQLRPGGPETIVLPGSPAYPAAAAARAAGVSVQQVVDGVIVPRKPGSNR